VSQPPDLEEVCYADGIVRPSIPTRVHIYPGLTLEFRRWTKLHAAEAFDSDIIQSINVLISSPEGSQESEDPWSIYSG
jgi:hypothetical protein